MNIRRATHEDIPGLDRLLCQVLNVHHSGRPDIFKSGGKKYTDEQLKVLLADDNKPVFVYVKDGFVAGYAFCIFQQHIGDNILTDIKTLYIDDLCVDENFRGQHIGRKLFEHVRDFAQQQGCYNLTLNVWALNDGAIKFYESCGLKPQKIGMEEIL